MQQRTRSLRPLIVSLTLLVNLEDDGRPLVLIKEGQLNRGSETSVIFGWVPQTTSSMECFKAESEKKLKSKWNPDNPRAVAHISLCHHSLFVSPVSELEEEMFGEDVAVSYIKKE